MYLVYSCQTYVTNILKNFSCEAVFEDGDGKIKDENYGKEFEGEKFEQAKIAIQACQLYPETLVEVQDPEKIEIIAGATHSQAEFKEAVWNALKKAKK